MNEIGQGCSQNETLWPSNFTKCQLCERPNKLPDKLRFLRVYRLHQHALTHMDASFFSCSLCFYQGKSRHTVQRHQRKKHDKVHEKNMKIVDLSKNEPGRRQLFEMTKRCFPDYAPELTQYYYSQGLNDGRKANNVTASKPPPNDDKRAILVPAPSNQTYQTGGVPMMNFRYDGQNAVGGNDYNGQFPFQTIQTQQQSTSNQQAFDASQGLNLPFNDDLRSLLKREKELETENKNLNEALKKLSQKYDETVLELEAEKMKNKNTS
ncbi:unnamed protein product, partial [Mesorhabditis belari]|uniref:C2H2-type domain-containing protein n=1 Tax=Mesorhabditis belari TaxID=2138241 RepID=A0AAF3EKS7_9BILA